MEGQDTGMEGQDTGDGSELTLGGFGWDFGQELFPGWDEIPRFAVAAPGQAGHWDWTLGIVRGVPAMAGGLWGGI